MVSFLDLKPKHPQKNIMMVTCQNNNHDKYYKRYFLNETITTPTIICDQPLIKDTIKRFCKTNESCRLTFAGNLKNIEENLTNGECFVKYHKAMKHLGVGSINPKYSSKESPIMKMTANGGNVDDNEGFRLN